MMCVCCTMPMERKQKYGEMLIFLSVPDGNLGRLATLVALVANGQISMNSNSTVHVIVNARRSSSSHIFKMGDNHRKGLTTMNLLPHASTCTHWHLHEIGLGTISRYPTTEPSRRRTSTLFGIQTTSMLFLLFPPDERGSLDSN